jgi:hypothetical protein
MCCANAVCDELEGMDRQHICRSEESAGSGFLQLAAFFGQHSISAPEGGESTATGLYMRGKHCFTKEN